MPLRPGLPFSGDFFPELAERRLAAFNFELFPAANLFVLCRPDFDLEPGMPARLLLDSLLAQGVNAQINEPYGGDDGPGGAVGAYAAGR